MWVPSFEAAAGAVCRGEIVYPNPSAQYSSHAYQCKPAACNYGCSFFNVSGSRACAAGLVTPRCSQPWPTWPQAVPLCGQWLAATCHVTGSLAVPLASVRACQPHVVLSLHLQESQPAFTIEKQPGHHYIMLLDRGPRACLTAASSNIFALGASSGHAQQTVAAGWSRHCWPAVTHCRQSGHWLLSRPLLSSCDCTGVVALYISITPVCCNPFLLQVTTLA